MLPHPFTNALVLTGPTGSGKTQLALELAPRLDAEIVVMDSMTLYRGLDIGTAKPNVQERALVPHHLLDVLDPWQSASVAWWREEAEKCCQDIGCRGKQVLFVGGTPLYLKALVSGLFNGPPADAAVRERWTQTAKHEGGAVLHQRLAEVDPDAARRLHPNDVRRLVRALEVWELTGTPISQRQVQWRNTLPAGDRKMRTADSQPLPAEEPAIVWLDLPRPELYERINRRVEAMFAAGLVEEVRRLQEDSRDMSRAAQQALGYKEVLSHLAGQATLAATIQLVQTRTRHLAKRQITWFRHLPGCFPITSELTSSLWRTKMKH